MELIISRGKHRETVRVRSLASGYEVAVGERLYQVDSEDLGSGLRSLILSRTAADGKPAEETTRHAEASVHPRGDGHYDVFHGAPEASRLRVADPLTHLAQESLVGGEGGGRRQVTAYMPGRVVALLVAEGDEVQEGQGVLVLEAMKMENEIPAESSGKVLRLLVENGQAVDSGDPLFEIE